MKIIEPSVELYKDKPALEIYKHIELAARVCYKSEEKITDTSYDSFIKGVLKRGHEAVIEHISLTAKIICDRGVTHELVRHRLASYCQESTRYVCSAEKISPMILDENKVIELYDSGYSMKQIADYSNNKYKEWHIYEILEKNNISRRRSGVKLDESYFDEINTPEKAYLLGLIFADGSISKNNCVIICQKKEDSFYIKRLLEDFIYKSSVLGFKGGFTITSDRIKNRLIQLGIVPNKTYKCTKENINTIWGSIPAEYKRDFLRGLLDGDGCVRFFKQRESGSFSCNITWSGNLDLLNLISEYIREKYSYDIKVYADKKIKNFGRYVFSNYQKTIPILEDIYKNFKFPYGHAIKTSKVFEHISNKFELANWGSSKFQVICPLFFNKKHLLWDWAESLSGSEKTYKKMLTFGALPQEARAVLPNSLKTEIMVTMNLREWRHFFKLRCAPTAHPQMKQVADMLLKEMKEYIPLFYEDIAL